MILTVTATQYYHLGSVQESNDSGRVANGVAINACYQPLFLTRPMKL